MDPLHPPHPPSRPSTPRAARTANRETDRSVYPREWTNPTTACPQSRSRTSRSIKTLTPVRVQTKHVVTRIAHASTEIREDERTGDASLNFIPSLATDTAETKQGLMVPIRVSSYTTSAVRTFVSPPGYGSVPSLGPRVTFRGVRCGVSHVNSPSLTYVAGVCSIKKHDVKQIARRYKELKETHHERREAGDVVLEPTPQVPTS